MGNKRNRKRRSDRPQDDALNNERSRLSRQKKQLKDENIEWAFDDNVNIDLHPNID